MKNLFYLFLFFLCNTAYSQSLSVFDVDTTNFPIMKAKFFAFDENNKPIKYLSKSDFNIKENGLNRTILNVTCPSIKPPNPLSSLLIFDLSESMSGQWLDIQKETALKWINLLPLGQSDCAITSFSNDNYINQDFTTNITKLTTAINSLSSMCGTDYNAAMIDTAAGGILIAKTGKHKRVIIFFTDGQPNFEPRTQEIVDEAIKNNIVICCISFNNPVHSCMREFSVKTNGIYFEYIKSSEEILSVLQRIFVVAQNKEFCEIEWQSDAACNTLSYNTVLSVSQNSTKDSLTYMIPEIAKAKLEFTPSNIMFKRVNPGNKKDTTITLTATNSDFNLSIKSSNPAFTINPSNFTIKAGQSQNISVTFSPKDSSYTYGEFLIDNNNCPKTYYVSGGFYGKIPIDKQLKLTRPNGGEDFVIGSDSLITWEGIPESDNVKLEYSIDNESTWNTIVNNTNGLKYIWKKIPKPESNQCKVRIKQGNIGANGKPGTLQFTLEGNENRITALSWSPDGKYLATVGYAGFTIIYEVETGTIFHILNCNSIFINAVKWSPDGSRIATANDNTAIIWDVGTGEKLNTLLVGDVTEVSNLNWSPDGSRIATASWDGKAIIWDALTGTTIHTLIGHKDEVLNVEWSHDGNYLATASLDSTAIIWDALSGNIVHTLVGHTHQVIDVLWSSDAKQIATISKDSTSIIWDAETGKILHRLIGHTNYVYCLDWSPDCRKIATSSWDGTSIIWDAFTGAKLQILQGSTIRGVTKVKWNPDGTLLASSYNDGIGYIWDPISGANLYKLIGHSWCIWNMAWSPDGSRIATGGEDNARIWFIDDLSYKQQQDISDSVFSIVAPHVSSKDIDMKECLVGKVKDSVITDFIENIGSYPVRIDSLYFAGNDSLNFRLLSHTLPITIKPTDKISLEFGFAPSRIGLHSADIIILTQSDTILNKIVGKGYQPQFSVKSKILDFGQTEIKNERTFTDTALVKNISLSPITINKVTQMGPDKKQFEILSSLSSFTLQPNEERKLTLKFKPVFGGRTTGQVAFEYSGVGSPAIVGLFGTGIGSNLRIADDSAYSGDTRNLKLIIDKVKPEGMSAIAPNFEATIRFQNTILASINNPNWTISNDSTYLKIKGKFGTSNEIAQIPVVVGLGSVEETAIDIVNFVLKDDAGNNVDYDFESESGTFKLLGICPAGGNRFINPSGKINISSIKPNPSDNEIEVQLELVEKTGYKLIIVNSNGQTVKEITKTNSNKGIESENIEVTDLASGVYNLILQTESERISKRFLILK